MYKTGDRGCLLEDGSLVFLGCMHGDTVIKLRGFRIDLEEVGNAIRENNRGVVRHIVVTVHGEAEFAFLVAHIVLERGEEQMRQPDLDRLLVALPLPRYMIPSRIIAHRQLPMTTNGKVDRQSVSRTPLPDREGEAESTTTILTVSEGEMRLIWRDILGEAFGGAPITADTDFFAVGGSSLLLVRLQNALKNTMGVTLPLHQLYKASSLKKMAALASNVRGAPCEEAIDWENETSIPSDMQNLPTGAANSDINTSRCQILLTGAASFLGSEILTILLAYPCVAKVHCIAISKDYEKTLKRHEKVCVYSGSLGDSSLGLSSSEVAQLQEHIDVIIHAGSQGHSLPELLCFSQGRELSINPILSQDCSLPTHSSPLRLLGPCHPPQRFVLHASWFSSGHAAPDRRFAWVHSLEVGE
ncbi:hypothetical protein F4778DRAFT_744688 [Xylariomycetidae sp. FL2044]|nr:hypothetical protein F4778DRAFT_744688 [Xylariomycetidae sp. FL2044]